MMDLFKVRKETLGCENVIHLNNAGASLMPKPVASVLYDYLKCEENFGGYETAEIKGNELLNFYNAVTKLLNCDQNEIAFIENATRAWDMAFYSIKFNEGDRILTSIADYGSNIISYLQQSKRYNFKIDFIPNDESGQVDLSALEKMIDDKVKLISVSHIPTGNGLVNPVEEIGEIAKKNNILFLLDACQSVGQIPIDVKKIGCDFLSGTGRKYLRGPRGTGFLYVKKEIIPTLEPPFLDIHSADLISKHEYEIRDDAKRFENWEQNFAGKAALGKAVDYALEIGLENIMERIFYLADYLRSELKKINGIAITDIGIKKCGIVTFFSNKTKSLHIKKVLAEHKINVSVSAGSGNVVLYKNEGFDELVRASVHYYNTEDEIDKAIKVIAEI